MQGTKSTKNPSGMFLCVRCFFFETFIEKVKPVVMRDKWDDFERREKQMIGFFGSFRLSKFSFSEQNQRFFTSKIL